MCCLVSSPFSSHCEYVEEFLLQALPRFSSLSGHEVSSQGLIVLVMQYGKRKIDYLGLGRSQTDWTKAWKSNFLHPVLYYYDSLPTGMDAAVVIRHRGSGICVYLYLFLSLLQSRTWSRVPTAGLCRGRRRFITWLRTSSQSGTLRCLTSSLCGASWSTVSTLTWGPSAQVDLFFKQSVWFTPNLSWCDQKHHSHYLVEWKY